MDDRWPAPGQRGVISHGFERRLQTVDPMFPHRYPRPSPRSLALSLLLVTALTALALLTPVSADHGNGNSGTIKVHDGSSADPPQRNEPHVEGGVFVEGSNMAAEEGTLQVFSWPPTGDRELVIDTTWEADDGTPEHHFLAGPFELDCGHYRVEAQNGMEAQDFPGGTKAKMFWVEGCEAPEEPECGDDGQPECPEEPTERACPTDLEATANADESVTLTWTPAAGSDGTNIYRAVGDGDFEYLDTAGEGVEEYTDTTTTAGTSYSYLLTALFGNEESEDCATVDVAAIPVFPSMMAFGAATVLGAGAYLALALRRKP